MQEEKNKLNIFVFSSSALLILCYIFVFSEPLSAELSIQTRWQIKLDSFLLKNENYSIISEQQNIKLFSFYTSGYFGYFSPEGKLYLLGKNSSIVPVSDSSFVLAQADDKGNNYVLKKNDGNTIQSFYAENPFFFKNSLYSAEAGGSGLTSFDEFGHKLWAYRFSNHLSAFGAADGIVVGGTIDGYLEGVANDGSRAFIFAPGGSRLEVIFGLGISSSGKYIAAISGIDKQRLVILKKGGIDYKVSKHIYLDSDYREPSRVIVMEDEKHVLYRRPDGIGVLTVDGKVDTVLPIQADDFTVALDKNKKIAFLIIKNYKQTQIVVLSLPSTLLGSINLPDFCDYVRIEGRRVYFAKDNLISAFEFTEE